MSKSNSLETDRLQLFLILASLLAFFIGGITGFGYRLGLLGWLPLNLNLENIRHAHSHLMFFCWAVPLPLTIFLLQLKKYPVAEAHLQSLQYAVMFMLVSGYLAYPFFLLYGYHPVPLWGSHLPLSVILSGLVMVGWHLFTVGYIRIRMKSKTTLSSIFTLFEAALLMLNISSLGAWGVAVAQNIELSSPVIPKALTHFFLSVFTEGWCLLAALAVFKSLMDLGSKRTISEWPVLLLILASPFLFTIGLFALELNPVILLSTRLALVAGALALGYLIVHMLKNQQFGISKLPTVVALLIILLAATKLIATFLPAEYWIHDHNFRILYLHLLLLGVLSLAILEWLILELSISKLSDIIIRSSIVLVLLSLLLLTKLVPVSWSGRYITVFASIVAVLPALAVLPLLSKLMHALKK